MARFARYGRNRRLRQRNERIRLNRLIRRILRRLRVQTVSKRHDFDFIRRSRRKIGKRVLQRSQGVTNHNVGDRIARLRIAAAHFVTTAAESRVPSNIDRTLIGRDDRYRRLRQRIKGARLDRRVGARRRVQLASSVAKRDDFYFVRRTRI